MADNKKSKSSGKLSPKDYERFSGRVGIKVIKLANTGKTKKG